MKKFVDFLNESRIDEDISRLREVEEFFRFDESGNITGTEEGRYDWERDEVDEDDDGENLTTGATFGGEKIIDLDWAGDIAKEAEDDSETLKYLKGRGAKGIDDLQRDFIQYVVEPPDAPQTGYTLFRRKYLDKDGERHEVSPEEIQAICNQKNKLSKPPAFFTIDQDGTIKKNGKFITKNNKVTFLKKLNTNVEEWQRKNGDDRQIHYKWETGEDGKFTNVLMKNSGSWDDSDTQNLKRYDQSEYQPLTNQEDQEFLLSIINKKDNSEEKNAKKKKWSYDPEKKLFLYDGREIYGKELLKMVAGINGGITKDKRQKGYNEESSYWNHFKISVAGSKVGDVANFSLPPVITCNHDAPCIDDGCYAVKAYPIYPTSRTAQEINLGLLKDGHYSQFEEEVGKVFDRNNKKKMKYFRFFVSGDCFTSKLMDSICNIASSHTDVNFWMYTKQYALLMKYIGKIPKNLTVLVSCWGDFCPSLYDPSTPDKRVKEGGKAPFAELEEHFPLAYLDDGTEETKKYMNVEKKREVCPCTEDDEVVAHCDTCKKCFEVGDLKGNIVFKKH